MRTMTTFYLVRHGEPDWEINEKYKLKGHDRDLVPLTQLGIQHYRIQEVESNHGTC